MKRDIVMDRLKQLVKVGTDANIIVFDKDGEPDTFDFRLLHIMQEVARDNKISIHTVLLPVFSNSNIPLGSIINGWYIAPYIYIDSDELQDYYLKECGGMLPSYEGKKKEFVILAYGDGPKDVLLGAI